MLNNYRVKEQIEPNEKQIEAGQECVTIYRL